MGTGKSVAIGDLTGDGRAELVYSCEKAKGERQGVGWMTYRDGTVQHFPISGPIGEKFDRVLLHDVDRDDDLDAVVTEEHVGLGVVWYENPGLR